MGIYVGKSVLYAWININTLQTEMDITNILAEYTLLTLRMCVVYKEVAFILYGYGSLLFSMTRENMPI